MNALDAILNAVQTDPGSRGLARDPERNLFNACPGDFIQACDHVAHKLEKGDVAIVTGFMIASAEPPRGETDGPLGAVFLARILAEYCARVTIWSDPFAIPSLRAGLGACGLKMPVSVRTVPAKIEADDLREFRSCDVAIAVERVGPSRANGRCYSMRAKDITKWMRPAQQFFEPSKIASAMKTIGIGDGGNEIGMGKIPRAVIAANIENGDAIACRTATDYLIAAGVSNWGAYALAAGIAHLKGATAAQIRAWFDTELELKILETMVREGPLVDGVTGQPTVTVDGLTWEEYIKPFNEIREILVAS